MLNAYSTLLLVIFLLVLIVLIVSALTVRKKKKVNAQNYDKNRKDKAWLAGMKAYSKAYYIRNNKRIKSNARIAYKINRKNKLAAASALSKLRPGYVQEKFKKWYNRNKSSKQLKGASHSNHYNMQECASHTSVHTHKLHAPALIITNNIINMNNNKNQRGVNASQLLCLSLKEKEESEML